MSCLDQVLANASDVAGCAPHRTALRELEPLASDWGGPWDEATGRRFNHIEPHMAP